MTGSIKLSQTAKLGFRRAMLALAVWLLLAVAALVVGPAVHGEEAWAPVLLQSETASPPTAPITTTGGITETPPLPPLEGPTATITPANTPTPSATATPPPPTPIPTAARTATPVSTALPEPTDTAPVEGSTRTRQHYVRGNSNVVFQWGLLVDSLALGISYVWLIGGLLIGIGLPIVLLVLWVRSRRRRPAQE